MDEVLSARKIASRFGIPFDWVKAQAKAGNLPHLKAGRRFLFNPSAVAEALARMASQYPDKREVAASV